jgi:hypothetical protein
MALLKTDVSEDHVASIIMVMSISVVGTTLAVTGYVPLKHRFLQS